MKMMPSTRGTENTLRCCSRAPPDLFPCEHVSPRAVWRLPDFTPAVTSLDTQHRPPPSVWGWGVWAWWLCLCRTSVPVRGALLLQQVPLTHVLVISFRMGLLSGHEWAFLSAEIMCLPLFFFFPFCCHHRLCLVSYFTFKNFDWTTVNLHCCVCFRCIAN